MASILDRYGIKEVADVTFYALKDGKPAYPVLYLDTLKVSTIEQTAETADARGGKGNAKLISWDFGKEITVTLEDALFSAKSMAIMFGNGSVTTLANATDTDVTGKKLIMKTLRVTDADFGSKDYEAPNGKKYKKLNIKYFNGATGAPIAAKDLANALAPSATDGVFATFDIEATTATVIEISANSFPGTYYVTGDTFARSEADGTDEFFQFIIPKAKVTAENTITLEAEGDPSVFNMNLTVLRPDNGKMMYLVKYDLNGSDAEATGAEIYHNHILDKAAEG